MNFETKIQNKKKKVFVIICEVSAPWIVLRKTEKSDRNKKQWQNTIDNINTFFCWRQQYYSSIPSASPEFNGCKSNLFFSFNIFCFNCFGVPINQSRSKNWNSDLSCKNRLNDLLGKACEIHQICCFALLLKNQFYFIFRSQIFLIIVTIRWVFISVNGTKKTSSYYFEVYSNN